MSTAPPRAQLESQQGPPQAGRRLERLLGRTTASDIAHLHKTRHLFKAHREPRRRAATGEVDRTRTASAPWGPPSLHRSIPGSTCTLLPLGKSERNPQNHTSWNFQTTGADTGGQPPPRISERESCCPTGCPSPLVEGRSLVQSLPRAQVGDPENPKEGPSLGRGCVRDTSQGRVLNTKTLRRPPGRPVLLSEGRHLPITPLEPRPSGPVPRFFTRKAQRTRTRNTGLPVANSPLLSETSQQGPRACGLRLATPCGRSWARSQQPRALCRPKPSMYVLFPRRELALPLPSPLLAEVENVDPESRQSPWGPQTPDCPCLGYVGPWSRLYAWVLGHAWADAAYDLFPAADSWIPGLGGRSPQPFLCPAEREVQCGAQAHYAGQTPRAPRLELRGSLISLGKNYVQRQPLSGRTTSNLETLHFTGLK